MIEPFSERVKQFFRNLRCATIHMLHLDCEPQAWGWCNTCRKCGNRWWS
jgi:hypothetical protein